LQTSLKAWVVLRGPVAGSDSMSHISVDEAVELAMWHLTRATAISNASASVAMSPRRLEAEYITG
jgi:hypothetical protein